MPLIIGSTTPRGGATATPASKALPPPSRISRPPRGAKGVAELTMPEDPVAGLVEAFRVGSGTELATGVKASGSTGSSTVASSETSSSPASARGASSETSETEERAPQELRTATTDTTKAIKKIFLKEILLKRNAPQKTAYTRLAYNTGQEKQPWSRLQRRSDLLPSISTLLGRSVRHPSLPVQRAHPPDRASRW